MEQNEYYSIKEACQAALPGFVMTRRHYIDICIMEESYVSKDDAHMRFYGGHLLGVEKIVFSTNDRDKLFRDVLKKPEEEIEFILSKAVYKNHPRIPDGTIILDKQKLKVASDTFNIMTIFLIHLTEKSTELSPEEKEDCKVKLYAYMFYKFLGSLLDRRFSKFQADPAVAEAAYQSLNNKFILKKCQSYKALIYYLAEDTIHENNTLRAHMLAFDETYWVLRLISDPQTRLRGYINKIFEEYDRVYKNKQKVASTSTVIEIDSETHIKEVIKHPGIYKEYIKRQIADNVAFIKIELVKIVLETMPSINPNYLYTVLDWTSSNYFGLHSKEIDEAVEIVMEHAVKIVMRTPELLKDTANLIITIAGMYTSSKSKDEDLLKARVCVNKLVKYAVGTTNETAIASTRTGWMLYLVLRAFSMHHYS